MAKIKYLLPWEKKELFDVIDRDNSSFAVRNKAIFYLAEYCGLRAGEIGKIRLEYFRKDTTQIYCERLKGSRNNTLRIIDDMVLAAVINYLDMRQSMPTCSPYMFLSQQHKPISRKMLDVLIKRYCRHTKIPTDKHHFHVLKHTRAVELGEKGFMLQDIQWWLGHVNINNTMIYSQFTTAQQEHLYKHLLEIKIKEKKDAERIPY